MIEMEKDIEIVTTNKADKEADVRRLQETVSANLPRLTASALASALGATVVLKMVPSETRKMKYVPVNDIEALTNALARIAEYGNKFDNQEGGFFIVQQRPPDAKFWDMLTSRQLGKVPDEAKIDLTHKIDLVEIGRKAIAKQIGVNTDYKDPVPSTWM